MVGTSIEPPYNLHMAMDSSWNVPTRCSRASPSTNASRRSVKKPLEGSGKRDDDRLLMFVDCQ